MKLAFCLFKYFPFGGLQRDFSRIATECLTRGHEVHVFVNSWQGEEIPGVFLHFLKPRGFRNHTRCQDFSQQLGQKLAEEIYDLVIGFNKMSHLDVYYAADVCYKARVKNKSLFYHLQSRYKTFVRLEAEVFLKSKNTEIFLISPLQQAPYMDAYQTEAARFHLLPPGIAKDRIAGEDAAVIRAKKRHELNLTADDQMLLMVGSGFKTKGVDRSILSLLQLPDHLKKQTQLFIIGQDNPKRFAKLVEKSGLKHHVHFLGGRNDVPDFLLAADFLLHPSYHENTGTVLLEALASGLPVLTTDVCGYAHYISAANAGFVLPSPFSITAMTQTLTQMLQSKEREKWQQAALAFAKHADIYSMPKRAVDLIEAIGQKRHALS